MQHLRRAALLGLLLAVLALAASARFVPAHDAVVSYEGHQVLRFTVPSAARAERAKLMAWIEAERLDLWGVHPEWVDVRLDKAFQARVSALDLPFHVMIEDLNADLLAERASIAVRGPKLLFYFDISINYCGELISILTNYNSNLLVSIIFLK